MVEPQRDGGDRAPFARGATPDGKFVRLRTSAMGQKTYQGDYLGLTENHAIVKMLYKQGEREHDDSYCPNERDYNEVVKDSTWAQ